MTRIILDATNAFENELFEKLKNSLSPEDESTVKWFIITLQRWLILFRAG